VGFKWNSARFDKSLESANIITSGEDVSNNVLLENKDEIKKQLDISVKSFSWNIFFDISTAFLSAAYTVIVTVYGFVSFLNEETFRQWINLFFSITAFLAFVIIVYTAIKTMYKETFPRYAKHKETSISLKGFLELIENNSILQNDTTTGQIKKKAEFIKKAHESVSHEALSEKTTDEFLDNILTGDDLDVLENRKAFLKKYSEKKGWSLDAEELTIDQITEIREQEEWKNA
jgi:hypothetical protein